MIRTRIFIIKLAAVLASVLFTASALGQSYQGDITVLPVRCEQLGDTIYIDMDIHLSDLRVTPNVSVELAPYLVSATHDYGLPAVSIKGRTAYKSWERALSMESPAGSDDGVWVVKGYETDAVLQYRHTMPYEVWMAEAGLNMSEYNSSCGNSALVSVMNLIDRMVLEPITYTPFLAFVVPEARKAGRREQQLECRLDFVVNKTNINPTYMNNPSELARIRSIIDELIDDPAISIVSIEILGKASPEGNIAANYRLSEGRALSMQNYLASTYNFPLDVFRPTFGGENWEGLVRELQERQIDHYEEILDIIETTAPDQTRKNKIMRLHSGVPYRYMLRNIYPWLRTVVCKVEYQIMGLEIPDILEIYRTRPRDLNLNEFYLVAGEMEKGSTEFTDVFETALRVYPDDEISNLNAAIAALREEDTQRAEACLEKVVEKRNLPEYHNAMGALLLLQGDITGAQVHFEQAAGELEAASENLKMIINQ